VSYKLKTKFFYFTKKNDGFFDRFLINGCGFCIKKGPGNPDPFNLKQNKVMIHKC